MDKINDEIYSIWSFWNCFFLCSFLVIFFILDFYYSKKISLLKDKLKISVYLIGVISYFLLAIFSGRNLNYLLSVIWCFTAFMAYKSLLIDNKILIIKKEIAKTELLIANLEKGNYILNVKFKDD